jgi:hypothetical protein
MLSGKWKLESAVFVPPVLRQPSMKLPGEAREEGARRSRSLLLDLAPSRLVAFRRRSLGSPCLAGCRGFNPCFPLHTSLRACAAASPFGLVRSGASLPPGQGLSVQAVASRPAPREFKPERETPAAAMGRRFAPAPLACKLEIPWIAGANPRLDRTAPDQARARRSVGLRILAKRRVHRSTRVVATTRAAPPARPTGTSHQPSTSRAAGS